MKPAILLQITATPRLSRWQIGSRILIALIVAVLFFGVGALWERQRTPKPAILPRVHTFLRESDKNAPQGTPNASAGVVVFEI